MRKHIPNIITSLNLLTGCAGIFYLLEINFYIAALLIFLAALFDFLDGFFARLLKASSPFGKSLDSLADMISFGVLPGLLLMKLQLNLTDSFTEQIFWQGHGFYHNLFILAPLLIPLASAIRLAKFDNDPEQSREFRGLPTPANAVFIAALIWSAPEAKGNPEFIYNPQVVFALNILLAFLLISPFRFVSLKFRNYKLKDNFARILVVLTMLVSLLIWKIPGIMIGIGCYTVISVVTGLAEKIWRTDR